MKFYAGVRDHDWFDYLRSLHDADEVNQGCGYITVVSDYHIKESYRLKEEFENGPSFYPLHGKLLMRSSEREDE